MIFDRPTRLGTTNTLSIRTMLYDIGYAMPSVPETPDARHIGHGGGGASWSAGGCTPFFCRSCGKTVSRKHVKKSCDVCSKCRSRGRG